VIHCVNEELHNSGFTAAQFTLPTAYVVHKITTAH